MYIRMYVCIHACMHVYVCEYTYMHVCVSARACARAPCICAYSRINVLKAF